MTKVLVFESDAAFAGELRTELGRLGCQVHVVDDGNVGLQAAQTEQPDLILLSIELPRMNGFSVCNKLKKDMSLKSIPLLIMSSESSEETFEQHRKLRTRAEDYVRKPIAFGELLQHIKALVPIEAGAPSDSTIFIDDEAMLDDAPDDEGTLVMKKAGQLRPSVKPAVRPAADVQPPAVGAPGQSDDEIEEFIGGAFERLLGEEEEARTPVQTGHNPRSHLPAAAAAATGTPSPPAHFGRVVPEDGGLTAPVANSDSDAPPTSVRVEQLSGASFRVSDDGGFRPQEDSAQVERLRGELARAKDEIVRLTKEVAVAVSEAERLEGLSAGAEELARARREVDELKSRLATGPKSGVSSKDFLDLREALNKKDKEILGLRDQMSRKDKELIEVRDQALSLEREKADQDDRLLEVERGKADLHGQVEALRADKELAAKRGEDFRARSEKLSGLLAQREADLLQGKQALSEAQAAHAAAVKAAAESAAAAVAAAKAAAAKAAEDKAAALATAEAARKRHVEEVEAAGRDALTAADAVARKAHAEAVAAEAARGEAALAEATRSSTAAHLSELDAVRRDHAAERAREAAHSADLLATRERELTEERESAIAEAAHAHATASQRAAEQHAQATNAIIEQHAQAMRAAAADHARSLERASEEHAQELATLRTEHQGRISSLESAAAMAARKVEAAHAAAMTEKEDRYAAAVAALGHTAEGVRRELEGRIGQLTSDLERALAQVGAADERAQSLDDALAATRDELASAAQRLASTEQALQASEEKRAQTTTERDQIRGEFAKQTASLAQTRERLDVAEARIAEVAVQLETRTEERDGARAEVDRLASELSGEQARLTKARAKWGEDRASLERARKALAAATAELAQAEERPID